MREKVKGDKAHAPLPTVANVQKASEVRQATTREKTGEKEFAKAAQDVEEPSMAQWLANVWNDKYMTPVKAGFCIIAGSLVAQALMGDVMVAGFNTNLWAVGFAICGPLMVLGGSILMAGSLVYNKAIEPGVRWLAKRMEKAEESREAAEGKL